MNIYISKGKENIWYGDNYITEHYNERLQREINLDRLANQIGRDMGEIAPCGIEHDGMDIMYYTPEFRRSLLFNKNIIKSYKKNYNKIASIYIY